MREVDMSPAAVERRLKNVARLFKQRRRKRRPVDMSSAAVERRLETVSQLRDLCLMLAAAGR